MLLLPTLTHGLTVWPKPQQQTDTGVLHTIDQSAFAFSGAGHGASSPILLDAFKRYRGIILRAASHRASVSSPRSRSAAAAISGAVVTVASADETLSLETDVSYNLTVATPTIKLQANTVFGALNGLESLSQLVDRDASINGTSIQDWPRYQFRATMIDTSRHYYPVEVILQHLDASKRCRAEKLCGPLLRAGHRGPPAAGTRSLSGSLTSLDLLLAVAYAKLNVLHWHIVDSISFPYQSTVFPQMSTAGAYSPDHVYTADDIKGVVGYALHRGIRVIPEFDTPGHVREGYLALDPPILTTCYGSDGKPLTGVAATGPLDVTLDATYTFLETLYGEIKTVFPDKFVHVGGDEVPSSCWASNPGVQAYMRAHSLTSFADLETLYEQRLLDMLKKQGTSYIVWQEIFDNGAKIAPDTVIDVWKGGNWQEEMATVTRAGFHSVLSAPFYLNYISYGEDWPKYYQVEPSNFTGGADADKKGLVGGVEVCMW